MHGSCTFAVQIWPKTAQNDWHDVVRPWSCNMHSQLPLSVVVFVKNSWATVKQSVRSSCVNMRSGNCYSSHNFQQQQQQPSPQYTGPIGLPVVVIVWWCGQLRLPATARRGRVNEWFSNWLITRPSSRNSFTTKLSAARRLWFSRQK